MDAKWSRCWFAATAGCAVAGVIISMFTAANNHAGFFHSSVERAFNAFAFFTILSNLIVAGTSAALAFGVDLGSVAFRVARLTGLVCITVTGIVYHVAIAHLLDLDSWDLAGDQLVHTVVPILAVVGWLLIGPRRLITRQIVLLSLIFPVAWIVFTFVRGAIVDFYPYEFIDVKHIGYAKTAANCVWVAVLLLGLAAGAAVVDNRLGRQTSVSAG